MAHPRFAIRGLLAGLAALGVVAAHAAAYFVAEPDPNLRAALLHITGHAGWSLVLALAVGALTLGLSGFVVSTVRHRDAAKPVGFRSAALRLCILQVVGFIGLEAGERALSGHGIGHLLHEPVVLIGLATQIAVALLGALLLVGFARSVLALVRRCAQPVRRTTLQSFPVLQILGPRFEVGTGSGTLRGPPLTR